MVGERPEPGRPDFAGIVVFADAPRSSREIAARHDSFIAPGVSLGIRSRNEMTQGGCPAEPRPVHIGAWLAGLL